MGSMQSLVMKIHRCCSRIAPTSNAACGRFRASAPFVGVSVGDVFQEIRERISSSESCGGDARRLSRFLPVARGVHWRG